MGQITFMCTMSIQEIQDCDIESANQNAMILKHETDELAAVPDDIRWPAKIHICKDEAVA